MAVGDQVPPHFYNSVVNGSHNLTVIYASIWQMNNRLLLQFLRPRVSHICSENEGAVISAIALLGGLGRVVNSLDFYPASLKSLGCFYFWCVLSSQWKAVTVN